MNLAKYFQGFTWLFWERSFLGYFGKILIGKMVFWESILWGMLQIFWEFCMIWKLLYPPQTKFGGCIGITQSVRRAVFPSVCPYTL